MAPEFSKEGFWSAGCSQSGLHIRIAYGALKYTDAQTPPQRFQFNWSDELPGYQELKIFPNWFLYAAMVENDIVLNPQWAESPGR